MANAGAIESSIRVNLKQLRQDLLEAQTLVRIHVTAVQEQTNRITAYIESMQRKQGKTLTNSIKEIKSAYNLFIKLYNATSKDDVQTRNSYAQTLDLLTQIIAREQTLRESSAKRAAKKKAEADELKRIERENIALEQEKERVAQRNAAAERARNSLIIEEERKKQEAYKRSLIGRIESEAKNIAFLAAWKLRNAIINLVNRSIRDLIKTSIDYEASLSNTQAVAQATAEGLNALDEAAQKAGMTTKFTASESAQALYELASAGFDAYESTEALNGVLLMAAATNESVAETATLVAATIRQFRMEASDADKIANILTASISTSQATMAKLKTSLTQAGTVASGLNVPLEHMVGLLDLMYDSGMQASRAGRAMRNVLAELASENSRTVKKLKEMGIAFEDIDVNTNSLVDVFASLSESGLSTGQIMEAFGKVIGPQMMILIRSSRQELESYVDKITDTNRASTAAATQIDNLKGDIKLLQSAWQALGITLSKWWIPIARSVVQVAKNVTRSINTITSDLLGLTTSTEKYKRLADDIAVSVDNYRKFTDLLTKSTGELTQQQKALYETEIKRARLDTLKGLNEVNDGYEEQMNVISEVARLEGLSKRWQDDRMANYEKLAIAIKQYDILIKGSTSADATSNAKIIQLTKEREDAIMSLYLSIVTSDEHIEQATGAVQHIEGISDKAKKAMLDINDMNKSASGFAIPAFTDEEGVIRYAQTFDELMKVIKNTPYVFDMLNSTLSKNSTYLDKIRVLNKAALTISTERTESERDVQSVIEQTARYLQAEIITEKDLVGYNPKMVEAIMEKKKALDKQGDAQGKVTVITAAAYEEMIKQLELTNEVRDAIAKDIEKTMESTQSNIEKADSLAMINAAYEIQINSARVSAEALRKEAEERAKERIEKIESARAAEELSEAEIEEAETLGISAEEMLKLRIQQTQLNEETAISEQLTRQETQALAEKTLHLMELNRIESDYIREREEAYAKSVETTNKWSKALIESEDKRLKDYDTIIQQHGAFGVAQIEENTEARIEALSRQRAIELEELRASFAKENAEAKSTNEARKSALQKEYAENLRALNEYLRLYNLQQDNNAQIEIGKIQDEYQTKIDAQKIYLETDLGNKAKYDAEIARLESERNDKILAIEANATTNKTIAAKKTNEAIQSLGADHANKVMAEDAGLNGVLIANAEELSEEEIALAKKTAEEEEAIALENAEAKKKAWAKTLNDFKDYINNTQQLLSALSAFFDAQANAEIAAIDRTLKAKLDARKSDYEDALEKAGFMLDTELESLQKRLEEAKASADEEAVIEAQRALEKYNIKKKYEDDVKELEDEAAKEKGERQYEAAMTAYKYGIAEISLNTAKAIMQVWSDMSIPKWLAWTYTAAAGTAGALQLAAAVASKPVKEDYFATGGIVRGTPEGTHAIVGEGNRTEAIFNPDQMANLLMAIAQGGHTGTGSTSLTIILKNMYDKETARYVIEDVVNKGVILIDGQRGIKGVAR